MKELAADWEATDETTVRKANALICNWAAYVKEPPYGRLKK